MTELDLIDIGSILAACLQQIMYRNTIYYAQDGVKYLQPLYPVFLCLVNNKRTWSFDGKTFGSNVVIFCIICNTFWGFNLSNIILPFLAIWHLRWTIHDVQLKRFVSILSFDSTISCGVGGHLLVVYVHGTSFESFELMFLLLLILE